jgi:hypothetical protein
LGEATQARGLRLLRSRCKACRERGAHEQGGGEGREDSANDGGRIGRRLDS